MSEPTLKTCSKITSLKIERTWLNTKNGYWYTKREGKPKALHRILAETYLSNPSDLGDVSGAITLGVMQQILRAFGRVEGSMMYLFKSWSTIIELLSVYKRLNEFEKELNNA